MLSRRGFTLFEMLVVIALLAILFAIMLPAVQRIRESGNRVTCANHLRNIGAAFHAHKDNWKIFPDGGGGWWEGRSLDANGRPLVAPKQRWGWAYQILPYIDQINAWKEPNPAISARQPITIYFCPSRRAPVALSCIQSGTPAGLRGAIDFAGNGGTDGTFPCTNPNACASNGMVLRRERGPIKVIDVKDGLATTLLVAERNTNIRRLGNSLGQYDDNNGFIDGYDWDVIRWGSHRPARDRADNSHYDHRFGASHIQGMNCLFADGSLRFLHYGIEHNVFKKLSNRKDGQAVSVEEF